MDRPGGWSERLLRRSRALAPRRARRPPWRVVWDAIRQVLDLPRRR